MSFRFVNGTFLFIGGRSMYETPKLQVIAFEKEDVVRTSVFGDEWSDENANEDGWT